MATSGPMTLWRSGFVRLIRSSFWTSRLSAVPGEQFADHAKVLISGVGFWHTGIRAVRFSGQPLPTTHPMRCSTYCAAPRHSVGLSRPPRLRQLPGERVNQNLSPATAVESPLAGMVVRATPDRRCAVSFVIRLRVYGIEHSQYRSGAYTCHVARREPSSPVVAKMASRFDNFRVEADEFTWQESSTSLR
jgi:hypothetical protein